MEIEASVLQFSSLTSKVMNNTQDITAWECAMFYCVNQYSASVTDGVIQQQISQTWRNDSATRSKGTDLEYSPPFGDGSTFKVASLAAKAMNSFMSATFTGSGGINSTTLGSAFSSDVIHVLFEIADYPSRIENLAISMTNNIRQQNDGSSSPFEGRAFKTETYVRVRWIWFSYPVTIIFTSLLYLLSTIIESAYRDVSIWKSNNMVMLFHGHKLKLHDPAHVPVTTMSEMKELYEGVKVELVRTDDDGWKLVQRPVE